MVSDLKTFVHKGWKVTAPKTMFILAKFALLAGFFFGIGATIRIGQEMLCLLYAGFFIYDIEYQLIYMTRHGRP